MKQILKITGGLCFALIASTAVSANSDMCYKYDYTHPITKVYTPGMTDADNAAIFSRGLPAATCIGYYTYASKSMLDDNTILGMKNVVSNVAQMVEEDCVRENVPSRETAEENYEFGEQLVVANASIVEKGSMSMNEFQARIQACSSVTMHYLDVFKRISGQ